jgi:hypothetical protein
VTFPLIPQGFRRAAETFNQYKKVKVKFYHHPERALAFLVVEPLDKDPMVLGPLTAGDIETVFQTLEDVMAMKTGMRYLE